MAILCISPLTSKDLFHVSVQAGCYTRSQEICVQAFGAFKKTSPRAVWLRTTLYYGLWLSTVVVDRFQQAGSSRHFSLWLVIVYCVTHSVSLFALLTLVLMKRLQNHSRRLAGKNKKSQGGSLFSGKDNGFREYNWGYWATPGDSCQRVLSSERRVTANLAGKRHKDFGWAECH